MPLDALLIIVMVVTGSLVGLISSYFGVGACFIMVPIMITTFQSMGAPASLSPLLAFGTNMAIVVPTALSGVIRHRKTLKEKASEFPLRHYLMFAIPVGIGSGVGALCAFALVTSYRAIAGLILKTLFGIVALVGAYQFLRSRFSPISELPKPSALKYGALGFLSGLFAHFIGIGGGLIYVPVLNTLLEIPILLSVALSLGTMIVGSSVGALSFAILGSFDQALHPLDYPELSFGWFNLTAFLIIGVPSVLFAQVGPKLAHKTSPKKFKALLAAVYVYVGVRLIVNGLLQIQGLPSLIP
ncbi:MAG: sulfite exporter TauE/SafE family protein [Candidatus Odinarchaeia archaeon]